MRYNSDGTLDGSFDGDGKLTTDFGASEDHANSVVLQTDGKILAAGYSSSAGNVDFALVRYNSDGSLDVPFGADGRIKTDFGAADFAYSVAIQTDGRIVVAGNRSGVFALALK